MNKNYSDFKIALAGAQGVGKTTLMNQWVEDTGAPVVRANTSDFMPEGITDHLSVIKLGAKDPQAGINFQTNLILTRAQLFNSSKTGFISDRSVFDSLAYYAVHNAPFAGPNNLNDAELRDTAKNSLHSTDLVMLLSPRLSQVDSNSVRATNITYYSALSGVLRFFLVDAFKTLHGGDFDRHEIKIDLYTSVEIWSPNQKKSSAIAFLSEARNPLGIATTETRIEALKKVCNLIR